MASQAVGPDESTPEERPGSRSITYREAIAEALAEEMERDERVVLLGPGSGSSKPAADLLARFGPQRVLAVAGPGDVLVGMAVGAALEGFRPVVEIADAELVAGAAAELAMTAILHLTGPAIPLVVRVPSGRGPRSGEGRPSTANWWFARLPGLKVISPAFPADAKGLLKAAIRDDDPCVVLEHAAVDRRVREEVSDDSDLTLPLGVAQVRRIGEHVTIVAFGAMVHRALEAADDLAGDGISAEVVDLRTVAPLDTEAVLGSVARTTRCLVLDGSHRFLGIGAEVAATIAEEGFRSLDAPVVRMGAPSTPEPFSPPLEQAFTPQVDDIVDAVRRLAEW